MVSDLQKAGIWKRIAAWMFDGILIGILAVGLGVLLSGLLGYDAHSDALDAAYARYESEYGVVFEISQEEYLAQTPEQRTRYEEAYEALTEDEKAVYHYNMVMNLSLVVTTLSIFLAIFVWEFLLPLWFGNGQTLGKKIFGLCLVRNDCVKMNTMQLFARTILGKFTIETMIPVYILLMLFWGTLDLTGTLMLLSLAVAQAACLLLTRNHAAIHDLLAGTAVVDLSSQTIFRSTEDLIAFQKKVAAERAARQPY